MRLFVSVAVAALFTLALPGASLAQSFSCPAGTEDMLNYFVMGYPNRVDHYMGPGNANPVYSSIDPELLSAFPTQGYFVWIKSASGYPWDVKTFNANYVYDRSTELNWSDPTSFKRFNHDLPLAPRCVPTGQASKRVSISPSGSAYTFYSNCTGYKTANLAWVLNYVTKPGTVNAGGNLNSVLTRQLKYEYGCTSTFSSCSDLEVFSLGYKIGLYDWKHYTFQNGSWTLQQDSKINTLDLGQTTPQFACTNTYQ